MSPISLLKQGDDTDQELSDDESENHRESTLSSDIEEDYLDQQKEVLLLAQVCQDKSLRTTRVPLPMNERLADAGIARPPLPNSQNSAGQWHHHCSKAKSQPSSTYYLSLTMHHPPRRCCYACLVETRMFHNPRPVQIRTFPNTKRLLLR